MDSNICVSCISCTITCFLKFQHTFHHFYSKYVTKKRLSLSFFRTMSSYQIWFMVLISCQTLPPPPLPPPHPILWRHIYIMMPISAVCESIIHVFQNCLWDTCSLRKAYLQSYFTCHSDGAHCPGFFGSLLDARGSLYLRDLIQSPFDLSLSLREPCQSQTGLSQALNLASWKPNPALWRPNPAQRCF